MNYLCLPDGSIFEVDYSMIAGFVLGFFLLLRLYLVARDSFGKPKE